MSIAAGRETYRLRPVGSGIVNADHQAAILVTTRRGAVHIAQPS